MINSEVDKQLEYNNLLSWHEAGYTGKGINILNTEAGTEHGDMATIRIKHSAPDCNVFEAGMGFDANADEVTYAKCKYNGTEYDIEEFIKRFGIKIITRSVAGSGAKGGAESRYWNTLKDKYNLIIFNSSGNKGQTGGSFPSDVAIYVGACAITDGGAIRKSDCSAPNEEVDFVNFMGDYIGTSFAAPYTAGMAACLLQKNLNMTQNDIYDYFKNHAQDLDKQGRDINTGWGVPIMGNHETIIKLVVGSDVMTVDGNDVKLDQPPEIVRKTGRTLVPVRAISEAFGATVDWDEKNKIITITR